MHNYSAQTKFKVKKINMYLTVVILNLKKKIVPRLEKIYVSVLSLFSATKYNSQKYFIIYKYIPSLKLPVFYVSIYCRSSLYPVFELIVFENDSLTKGS